MQAMIAGNLLNMILDPVLIFGCGLGLPGAALASLLGWMLSAGLLWYSLYRRDWDRPTLEFSIAHRRYWREIFPLGAPASLSMLIAPLSAAAINYLLAGFGPIWVGAWSLSNRIERILILPLYGLSSALVPFVGFNLGQRQFKRIHRACVTLLRGSYCILLPIALLLWYAPELLIGLFHPAPEVLKAGAFALKIAGPGYLFIPFELVLVSLSQGLKQPRWSLLISAFRLLALRLPLAFLFAHFWLAHGIYLALPTSFAISGLISLFVIKRLWRPENLKRAAIAVVGKAHG
jgi:putative MATE family efflux protein